MKKFLFAIVISAAISAVGFAQDSSRVFDNFDRSQGVPIYYPPPPPETAVAKRTRRVKRKGKWVTIEVPASGRTRKTASVSALSDGYGTSGYLRTRLVMGSGNSLRGFTTGNPLYDKLIEEASRRHRIDPLLIYAQMHQESSFKPTARSHKGAAGLMQLIPATARRFGVTKIYDPKQNIDAGVLYMRWLLDLFDQDVVLALAGYNAGEGAVLKYGRNVPPYRETREYVRRITARYAAISNPGYVETVRKASPQVAKLEQKDPTPLTIYEPNPVTVHLSDGRKMLRNQ